MNKMKRLINKVRLLLVLILLLMSISGCEKKQQQKEKVTNKGEQKIQIGMSFDSFVIERWQRDRDVFVSMAKELGAEVNVQNANGDVEEQKKQIEYFINKGVDVIVIICIDSDSLADSVADAKDAGIKVIAYDRLINDANVDLYISFDNKMVGTLMANALIDAGVSSDNGDGTGVIMIGGDNQDSNVPQLEQAFIKVMRENDVTILDSTHSEGWKAELAADYIYNHMDEVNHATGIMCGNDNLASQAIRALAEKRLAGKIYVVGQDADLEACQRIVEGTQEMTVYKPVERLAKLAAECAVMLAKEGKIPGDNLMVINDGTYDVPYVKLDPISVTKENIDEVIIGSGFHYKEDVYLNVPEKMPKDN